MKLLAVRVQWRKMWANSPDIQILVDRMPTHEELRYECREGHYLAEKDGYVQFFAWWGKGNGGGYGGREFPVTMKDGSTVTLEGPWSSRSGVVNAIEGFPQCTEVHITDDPRAFKRGHTFYAGHVTVAWLRQQMRELPIGVRILSERTWINGERYYLPAFPGMTTKSSKKVAPSDSYEAWRRA